MTDTEMAALKALMAKADLVALQPVGFLARVEAALPEATEQISVSLATQLNLPLTDAGFDSAFHLTLTAKREGSEGPPFVRFVYHIVASYAAPRDLCADEAVRVAFAEHVALLQAWPYARAFVQSSCAQLGVPAILLPTIRAGSIKMQAHAQPAPPAAEGPTPPETEPPIA